jgi:hypothetical protein
MRIPLSTQLKLASPAGEGNRHNEAMTVALSLFSAGMAPDAIRAQLICSYNLPDKEVQNLVQWAAKKARPYQKGSSYSSKGFKQKVATSEEIIKNVEKLLNGFYCNEFNLQTASPYKPLENWQYDALMMFATLYDVEDHINIVSDSMHEGGKEKPIGAGKTLTRDNWLRYIRDNGVPQCTGGAWIRPNPVKSSGSGKGKAYCDEDVVKFRFLLLESDILPPELQLALYAKLRIPISAIIWSGRRSYHCWIEVNCSNAQEYRQLGLNIFERLRAYGIDPANINPSRMSRLPGAVRHSDQQRLIYLNPEPKAESIF